MNLNLFVLFMLESLLGLGNFQFRGLSLSPFPGLNLWTLEEPLIIFLPFTWPQPTGFLKISKYSNNGHAQKRIWGSQKAGFNVKTETSRPNK